jgi:ubiquitin-protein ligase
MLNNKLIKRIDHEIKMIREDPLNFSTSYPDENNIKIWYSIFIGLHDTVYSGGHYIFKILLPDNYPFSPPDIVFLTPNGRFEINKKICLTITGYHPDMWQATITIKTMLIQIFTMFNIEGDNGNIGHLIPPNKGTSQIERKQFAEKSISYNIANYKEIYENFDMTYLNDGSIINKKKETIIDIKKDDIIKEIIHDIIKDEKKDDIIKEIIHDIIKDEKKDDIIKEIIHDIIKDEKKDEKFEINNQIKEDVVKKRGRPRKVKID